MSRLFEDVNKAIGKDLYSRNGDVCLGLILEKYNLPDWFLDKYYDKFGGINIAKYQILSEDFIERHKSDSRFWGYIIYSQKLSEKFILKYNSEFCFSSLVTNQILSMNFIEKYFDISSLDLLCNSQPFIDYDRLINIIKSKCCFYSMSSVEENIKERLEKKNYLYQQYKKGKDWFIRYVFEDELDYIKKNIFTIKEWNYFGDYVKNNEKVIKVKIFWEDLLCLGFASKVYPIREVKYV